MLNTDQLNTTDLNTPGQSVTPVTPAMPEVPGFVYVGDHVERALARVVEQFRV